MYCSELNKGLWNIWLFKKDVFSSRHERGTKKKFRVPNSSWGLRIFFFFVPRSSQDEKWATNYNFKKIHDDNFSIRYAYIDLNIYTITFIQVLLLFLWGILWFRLWYFCWCGLRWCQSLVRGVFRDNSCGTSFGKNSSYRIDNSYNWKKKNQHGSFYSVLRLLWWRVFKNLSE